MDIDSKNNVFFFTNAKYEMRREEKKEKREWSGRQIEMKYIFDANRIERNGRWRSNMLA